MVCIGLAAPFHPFGAACNHSQLDASAWRHGHKIPTPIDALFRAPSIKPSLDLTSLGGPNHFDGPYNQVVPFSALAGPTYTCVTYNANKHVLVANFTQYTHHVLETSLPPPTRPPTHHMCSHPHRVHVRGLRIAMATDYSVFPVPNLTPCAVVCANTLSASVVTGKVDTAATGLSGVAHGRPPGCPGPGVSHRSTPV